MSYNLEKYIAEALDSILMQKVNFKYNIVVSDDYSTDKTRKILQQYAVKYPDKITLLLQENNLGVVANFVETLKACEGKYIALLDGDDYWTDPLKLQKQVDFLESNKDFSIVFHNAEIHDETTNGIKIKLYNPEEKSREYTYDEIVKTWSILTFSVLAINSKQYRYIENNLWFPVQDMPFYLSCASMGKIYYMSDTMGVYRRLLSGSMNSKEFRSIEHNLNSIEYLKVLHKDFGDILSKETIGRESAIHYRAAAYKFKKNDDERNFLRYLALAMAQDPKFIYEHEIHTAQNKVQIIADNKLEVALANRERKLKKIYQSKGWKFLTILYKTRDKLTHNIEKIQTYAKRIVEFAKMHFLALKHSLDLELRQNNLGNIKKNDILLFSTMKNETFRLPYFLKYYRDLGVDHFIFVNNDSNDGMMETLKDQKDITVYYTDKSYRDSHFGLYWLNFLLKKYGTGHWCLTCDPDEFLVFPHIESRNLNDLTNYLDAKHIKSLYAPLIDMYSDKPVHEAYYKAGDDPLKVCPYFDKNGYRITGFNSNYRQHGFKGGVRQRVFNVENPNKSPMLNKTPLVKWKKHYAYLDSTHKAIPRILNKNNNPKLTTGALLHFKFMDSIIDKIAIELQAKQHWDDSYEYKQYNKALNEHRPLYDKDISIKYKDWHTLEDLGLLNRGKW